MTEFVLDDAHCHVAFMADIEGFARDAAAAGSRVFVTTAEPIEFVLDRGATDRATVKTEEVQDASVATDGGAAAPGLYWGVGMHPWWVARTRGLLPFYLYKFEELLPHTAYVGEVGLDFSPRREHARDNQLKMFERIASLCAEAGGKVLSIHCVRAHDDALAILERTGCAQNCTCIFHWFSGSSQHLKQAIDMGCYFSVSERMLSSKRGREYAKAIPQNRLLLETDAPFVEDPEVNPPSVPYTYAQVAEELQRALRQLAEARSDDPAMLAAVLHENANVIFSAPSAVK